MTPVDSPLRERYRVTTRRLIADAAIDLVRENGLGQLRAEDIAARVGISRRTFFNHVGSTESALAIPAEDYLEAAHTNFLARPADEGLVAAMVAALREIEPEVAERFERSQVVLAVGGVLPRPGLAIWDRFERGVRDAIALRLPPQADALLVATVAAAVTAAGRTAAEAWAADITSGADAPHRPSKRPDLPGYVARALGYLTAFESSATVGRRKGGDP